MIEGLDAAVALLQPHLGAIGLVFVRIAAAMAVLPAFGEQSVPVRVRLAAAVAFAMVVFPAVGTSLEPPTAGPLHYLALIVPESVAGLLLGLGLRLFIMVLQIAGTIAAQSTSLSQIFGGSAGADPQPAMGHVLTIAGLALLALLGFHVKVAEYFILSYQLVPLGTLPTGALLAEVGVQEISRCFSLAFVLSAPFLIASLIYNVTLGAINRAMPQLMVAFVGAPAITAGGLVLLMLTVPLALDVWADEVGAFLDDPFGVDR